MTDRLGCCIPGCQRTTGKWKAPNEWMCSVHWGRLTRAERRVLFRLKRLGKRYGWATVHARMWRVWEVMKRRAGDGAEQEGG